MLVEMHLETRETLGFSVQEAQPHSQSRLAFKIHISNQSVLPGDWVLHSVYANIDNCCALFDHVGSYKIWNP